MLDTVLGASNETLYLIILIAALPWFLGAINASTWSPTAKTLSLAIASVVVAVGYLAAIGRLETSNTVRLALLIGAAATVVYKLFKSPISHWESFTDLITGRPDGNAPIALETHPDMWVRETPDSAANSEKAQSINRKASSSPFRGSITGADTVPREWLSSSSG